MTLSNDWETKRLSDVVEVQRGFDLPYQARRPGPYPVLTSGETGGFHDEGPIKGPGMTIGRATNLGRPKWSDGDFWPHNTTMFVKDFKGNNPKWVFHLFEATDLSGFNSGSVQPMLNRNYIAQIPVRVPPLNTQHAIAEVLGALDDKIAANTNLAVTSNELAGLIYDRAIVDLPRQAMSEILEPVLGGTPARANSEFWGGTALWASAKDVTGAPFAVITSTDEKITSRAVETTKAKPLPAGSVILTARGTVGAVARLAEPSSFNQSCYGFVPGPVPAGLLYFAILRASQQAKAIAHGSVFDTITKKTFDHLRLPVFLDRASEIEVRIAPLLSQISSCVRENSALAETREAILPQLMSGKLAVKDAEALVEAAI